MGCKPNNRENIEQLLRERTLIDNSTGCWLWQGSKTADGYGNIAFNYHAVRIHRLSAYLYLGLDFSNPNEQALHKCNNRNCWNPDHLFVGSNSDNITDKIARSIPQTHCRYGHLIDGIKSSGLRYCKTCNRERNKKYQVNCHLEE